MLCLKLGVYVVLMNYDSFTRINRRFVQIGKLVCILDLRKLFDKKYLLMLVGAIYYIVPVNFRKSLGIILIESCRKSNSTIQYLVLLNFWQQTALNDPNSINDIFFTTLSE